MHVLEQMARICPALALSCGAHAILCTDTLFRHATETLIQGKLADMYTHLEAARLLAYKSAITADKKERGGKGTKMHKLAAAAILFAGEIATRAALETVQIHGGYGYMLEFPVNRLYRDVKLYEIGAGTSEIRRLLIARELLSE